MAQNIYKVKIRYIKGEEVRFISHLDHIRVMERAIRRAELPVAFSEGFNPRIKISYLTRALKVGESCDSCEAELTFTRKVDARMVQEALNHVFPAGFSILDAELRL